MSARRFIKMRDIPGTKLEINTGGACKKKEEGYFFRRVSLNCHSVSRSRREVFERSRVPSRNFNTIRIKWKTIHCAEEFSCSWIA